MANINSAVASVTQAPDGTRLIDWANTLPQQAAMRKQAEAEKAKAAAAQAATTGGNDLMQMLQMLLSMLMSQMNPQ